MATSQNGWYASADLPTRPLVIAGESFIPGILDNDDVFTVLQYVAQQLHERVEPIVRDDWHQADDWGYYFKPNANDPDSLSNHSSGTAFDYNATRHPNGVSAYETFSTVQIAEINRILDEVEDVVRWGGAYSGTPDAMHFEIVGDRADVARVAAKIRNQEDYMGTADASRKLDRIIEQNTKTRALVKAVAEQVDTIADSVLELATTGDEIKGRITRSKRELKRLIEATDQENQT